MFVVMRSMIRIFFLYTPQLTIHWSTRFSYSNEPAVGLGSCTCSVDSTDSSRVRRGSRFCFCIPGAHPVASGIVSAVNGTISCCHGWSSRVRFRDLSCLWSVGCGRWILGHGAWCLDVSGAVREGKRSDEGDQQRPLGLSHIMGYVMSESGRATGIRAGPPRWASSGEVSVYPDSRIHIAGLRPFPPFLRGRGQSRMTYHQPRPLVAVLPHQLCAADPAVEARAQVLDVNTRCATLIENSKRLERSTAT